MSLPAFLSVYLVHGVNSSSNKFLSPRNPLVHSGTTLWVQNFTVLTGPGKQTQGLWGCGKHQIKYNDLCEGGEHCEPTHLFVSSQQCARECIVVKSAHCCCGGPELGFRVGQLTTALTWGCRVICRLWLPGTCIHAYEATQTHRLKTQRGSLHGGRVTHRRG